MTLRLRIIAFFLLISPMIYGQQFKHGYIVFNDGQKIYGFIQAKGNQILESKEVVFRHTETSPKQVYPIFQLKEVSFDGKRFVRAYVKVDLSGNRKFVNVKDYNDFFAKDTVFLQMVYLGRKSLYRGIYNDKDLFYISDNDSLVLLEAPWVIRQDTVFDATVSRLVNRYNYNVDAKVTQNSKLIELETYKFQLSRYLSDVKDIDKYIESTNYEFYSLYNLFRKYFKLTQLRPTYFYRMAYKIMELGFFGGGIYEKTSIFSETDWFYYLSKPDFAPYVSRYLGVYAEYTFWQTDYRVSLYYSLAYYDFYTSGVAVKLLDYPYRLVYGYSSIDMSFLDFVMAAKYNISLSPVRFSVYAGGTYVVPVSATNKVIEYGSYFNNSYVNVYDGFQPRIDGEKYYRDEAGVVLGMSLTKGRLGINAQATFTNGFLSPMRIWQRNTKFAISLTYSLINVK